MAQTPQHTDHRLTAYLVMALALLPALTPLGILRQAASVKKPEPGQLAPVARDAGPPPCAGVIELDDGGMQSAGSSRRMLAPGGPSDTNNNPGNTNMLVTLHRHYTAPARPKNERPDAGPSCHNPSNTSGEDWEHDPEPMGPDDPAYR